MSRQFFRTVVFISMLASAVLLSGCVIHTAGSASATTSKKNTDEEPTATDESSDDSVDEAPAVTAPDKAVKKSNMKRAGRPDKSGGETGTSVPEAGDQPGEDNESPVAEDDDAASPGESSGDSDETTAGDDAGGTQSTIDSAKQKAGEILNSYQNPK
jgi:hypothetical protein